MQRLVSSPRVQRIGARVDGRRAPASLTVGAGAGYHRRGAVREAYAPWVILVRYLFFESSPRAMRPHERRTLPAYCSECVPSQRLWTAIAVAPVVVTCSQRHSRRLEHYGRSTAHDYGDRRVDGDSRSQTLPCAVGPIERFRWLRRLSRVLSTFPWAACGSSSLRRWVRPVVGNGGRVLVSTLRGSLRSTSDETKSSWFAPRGRRRRSIALSAAAGNSAFPSTLGAPSAGFPRRSAP